MSLTSWLASLAITSWFVVSASADPGVSKGTRIIRVSDQGIATVKVHPDGTVINFPARPQIHVGKKDAFQIAYVERDLVISGQFPGQKTNLFVYQGGKRYTIKLTFDGVAGDQIVKIMDPRDALMEAKIFYD